MSGFLDHASDAPWVSVEALVAGRPLVILAPHPDDETLGCGALLFDAAKEVPCSVICVTDGSRSHLNSAAYPASKLAKLRNAELQAALSILAPNAMLQWLGHPDCGIPTDLHLGSLIPPNALLLASWEGDPHIDHESTARLARRISAERSDIALGFYPVWGRFTDRIAQTYRLRSSPEAQAAKRRALACHASQMTTLIADDPDGFVMEPWRQDHFLTYPEIVIAP